ncbi:cobalt-precorrin-6A reductase [Phaeobacter sp. 11ANDIMAR09]|uniref:cobalt-precorrin-6A reductase n=1 Tax=Phaeobacter sp. 11ANDIMAR09 TaxID=1225647 RepID=UPI0006C840A1|nr:cobalt-precorrin-6A reductase [Phaeobacter sp. 11ANDIMAR09]KPD12768.1 cobalt-precorrin-6X reductase [Phaeobacter sp. 11ANDIMAR09]
MTRTLVLGGTTEASKLARALAEVGEEAVFSYAGRTASPVAQPLPMRVGGFGGVDGLVDYLLEEGISHVVDATHPFAAQMSCNVVAACTRTGVPLCAFERPAWRPGPGDDWTGVADIDAAVQALPEEAARIFLAIGKQHIAEFAAKPQHHYLLRLVDEPEAALPLPDCSVEIARGPFDEAGDLALLQRHGITHLVSKNAGGRGASAKLAAARALNLPIIMIDRPKVPPRKIYGDVAEVMAWLFHTPG